MSVKNKKIALVTVYYQPNYGSQLQSYATQMAFDRLGLRNETINIEGLRKEIKAAKLKYFFSRIFDKNTVQDKMPTVKKAFAKKIVKGYAEEVAIREQKFKEFESFFRLSERFESLADLGLHANNYAAFVVGSDQLWLPSNITANYFTLGYVPIDVPKIALSTSFGVSSLPPKQARMAKRFLPRINHISVREISGQKIIKDLTGRDVQVICDPTILFNSEDWGKIIPKERFYPHPYIFCYFLGNNPEQRKYVKEIQELTGLKIVQMKHCEEYISSDEDFADNAPYNVGPQEFVQLIRDAEYIFTDSFHCSVFSILYHRQFYTFRRYSKESNVSTNGRLYSFLHTIGLEDRLLTKTTSPQEQLKKKIDYLIVDEKIEALRSMGWDWLNTVLKQSNLL